MSRAEQFDEWCRPTNALQRRVYERRAPEIQAEAKRIISDFESALADLRDDLSATTYAADGLKSALAAKDAEITRLQELTDILRMAVSGLILACRAAGVPEEVYAEAFVAVQLPKGEGEDDG